MLSGDSFDALHHVHLPLLEMPWEERSLQDNHGEVSRIGGG
jgi:hypothetical protein